jgi:hypothetical protein
MLILATASWELGSSAIPTGEHRGQLTLHARRRAFMLLFDWAFRM